MRLDTRCGNLNHMWNFTLAAAVLLGSFLFAIPPLSPGELKSESDLVVVGKISKMAMRIDDKAMQMQDRIFEVEITVNTIEKGQSQPGKIIRATAWQPDHRPRGWTGPQGQNETPVLGQRVRAYLRKNIEGEYLFLEPNGLEVLAKPSTQPSTKPSTQPSK